jgi:hypothetical protein
MNEKKFLHLFLGFIHDIISRSGENSFAFDGDSCWCFPVRQIVLFSKSSIHFLRMLLFCEGSTDFLLMIVLR